MGKLRTLVQIYASTSSSDVAATNEIDLGPYVNSGVTELKGVWAVYDLGAATDTDHTYDAKFQQSATTADTDFADITGGGFTQVLDGSEGSFSLSFKATQRHLRGYLTMGGTAVDAYNFLGVIVTPRFDT